MSAFTARYARALADVIFSPPTGSGRVRPEDAQSQLNDFAAAWHESTDLREVFLDPSFPVSKKVAILDKLNARLHMSGLVRNFVAVLINHERLESLDEILADFHHEMNTRLNIAEVEVTSARRLDEHERKSLESQIAGLTSSAISAKFREDPSLLGGVIVKVGSTVYDDSIRGRLSRLREQLAAS